MSDKYQQAKVLEYFEKHSIPQLLENLAAGLVYDQPDDPRAYLIAEVDKLIAARDGKGNPPGLIGAEELKAIFGVFDVVRTGVISLSQYKEAMKAAGVPPGLYSEKPAGFLMGTEGRIKLETFVEEGLRGLAKVNSTFSASA